MSLKPSQSHPSMGPDFTFPKGFVPPTGVSVNHTLACAFLWFYRILTWPRGMGCLPQTCERVLEAVLCWPPSPPGPTHWERILRQSVDRSPGSGDNGGLELVSLPSLAPVSRPGSPNSGYFALS